MTSKTIDKVSPRDFFKRASDVAGYYGFQPAETALQKYGQRHVKLKNADRSAMAEKCLSPISKLPEPIFLFYVNEHPRSSFEKGEDDQAELNLEILGTGKSVAEAILLKTALSIFEENGIPDVNVSINGIGDRDCLARFSRELSFYYRRHVNDLPTSCRTQFAKDVFRLLVCEHDRCRELRIDAPRPMNFLTEASRIHFREVLEYLEGLGVPYRVSDSLVGPKDQYSKIVFEIRRRNADAAQELDDSSEVIEEPELLASGGRYDDLARRAASRKEASGVGISILFPRRALRRLTVKDTRRPAAYFVHIGFEAKLKSLLVLDLLRKAHIPVQQALHHDQLAGQMGSAEKLGIPYLLIMGQKEALEGTIIVRDMETRAQETVPVGRLSAYLRTAV